MWGARSPGDKEQEGRRKRAGGRGRGSKDLGEEAAVQAAGPGIPIAATSRTTGAGARESALKQQTSDTEAVLPQDAWGFPPHLQGL